MAEFFKGYDTWRARAPERDEASEYEEAVTRLRETQRRMLDLVEELTALACDQGDPRWETLASDLFELVDGSADKPDLDDWIAWAEQQADAYTPSDGADELMELAMDR